MFVNCLRARVDLCRTLMISVNSLDPDQDRQNVSLDPDPNRKTQSVPERFSKNFNFEKKVSRSNKNVKIYPACGVNGNIAVIGLGMAVEPAPTPRGNFSHYDLCNIYAAE